ncbi:YlbL family protein [Brevibacterium sp. UBA7493]|uniref:YlbL family protein n=1 Tax=Brevibacterium sp. UBA7493 TaxID=1946121 RepID=UPI00257B4A6A|nr:S16 family serine protease [Brevibacterium sp. UBA7493]
MTNNVGAGSGHAPEPAPVGAPQTRATSADAAAAPAEKPARKPRARSGGIFSGIITYGLVLACALIPVPYLLQMPGPVVNTLEPVDGKDLITISGTETYEAEGQLDMLTVAVAGGPGNNVYASEALRSVIKGTDTVVPNESYYPLTTTREDVTGQNTAQMASSQDTATAAALGELGIDYSSVTTVAEVVAGSPADGQAQPGDEITSINGTRLGGDPDAATAVASAVTESEGSVQLGLKRGDEELSVDLEPQPVHGKKMIGISMQQRFDFPFEVIYNVKDIGGPSAGMIFALTIIDELTPGNLTGGKPIAGTGAIDAAGTVTPIGGARQKVSAASDAGAEYFLSPAKNCAEVVDAAASTDLNVVRIDTLSDAHAAVEDIAAGNTDSLPQCDAQQGAR